MRDHLARARRYAGGLAAFAAFAVVSAVCADLTAPTGVNSVSIRFRNAPLPRPDTIFVTVGDRVAPPVIVMLGQTEQPRARYVFSTTNPFVARPFAGGDSVEIATRGAANLIATLVGTTIGNNVIGGATPQTADTVVLVAAAASNSVNPATVSFGTLGRTRQLTATSIGSSGQTLTGANVVWRSTNSLIVSVDPSTGVITSTGNGTADVYAVFEGVDSTFSRVTVAQTLDMYDLTTPTAPNLRSINETMQVTALAKDSLGNNMAAGATAPPAPTFQSDDPGKVEIDPVTGLLTARGNTTAPVRITATVAGVTRSDTLLATVRQVAASISIQSADTLRITSIGGQILNLSVLAPDAGGTQVPGSSIIWTSSNPAKAVVDGGATANITAQDTGAVKIAARADQQTDTVVVVITNDPAAIVVSPKPFALRSLDETGTLTATVTNAAGTPLTGVAKTWVSRDSAIVEPQPQEGVIRARSIGETRIVVTTANGRADSVTVRVTNAPDTVRIIPDTITLASVGDVNSTYAVDFKNGRGVALPKSSVTWSSADLNVASVAVGTGDITAQGAGLTYVLAVSPENPARRDSVYVRVTNSATSVTVSPNPAANLTAFGATTTFTATVTNASGQPISGAAVTWSVPVGGGFVSIDANTGVATALANGTATVRATSGSVTGDVSLTVAQAISATQSTITPAASSITADGTSSTTITVQLRDANGNNIAFGGSTVNVFTTLGTMGGVTGLGGGAYSATLTSVTTAGTATITASANGSAVGGSALVSFTAGTATKYLVNSSSFTPTAGTAVTITAQLADVNNNPVATAGSVVAWSSTGGGSFSSGTSTTNGSGVATVSFTTSVAQNPHTVTATTGSVTGTSLTITPSSGVPTNYVVSPATASPAAGSSILITAQLRDGNNNPVSLAGETVTWTKSSPDGAFSGATSTTNGSGVATITLTTHTVSGTATTVTATSAGPVSGTSATITTVAGAPTQLTVTQAPSATAQSGVPFPVQPTVQMRDANGNPVAQANVNVTATIIAGGGVLSGATTVQSDGTGLATFTDLAISGTNGARTLRFSMSGATPVTATVTIVAGTAAQIVPASATSQSATVGATVASVPAVQVRDASNNPVANHPVTFAITSGGGTTAPISGTTVNTDAAGIAALTSWTLGTTAGANALTATAAGLAGSPVSFLSNGTPDVVTAGLSSVARTGPDNISANGTASSMITVTLRDQYGNPVPGRTVALDDAGSTSVITPVTATSNASGQATFSLTNTTPETVTYTATANDPGAIVITQTAQVTFGNPVPTLTSVTPNTAVRGQNLQLIFTGSNFVASSTVDFSGSSDISINSVTVNSSTQITADVTISTTASLGSRNARVVTGGPGGGNSNNVPFTISVPPVPTLTGLAPNVADRLATLNVVLTGTGFASGVSTVNAPAGITLNSTTVNSGTQITANVTVPAGATLGANNFTVTNTPAGGTSGAATLTVNNPAPTLTSIAPASAERLQTVNVVFTGSGFIAGVSSVAVGADITVNAVTIDSPTQITAIITLNAATALGARIFTVTNVGPGGGTSAAQTFTVNNPAPTVTNVAPDVVTVGVGGATIASTTITGTGFVTGATVVDFVQGDVTIAGTVTVDSPTQITVTNIQYPGVLLFAETRDIRVTNSGRPAVTRPITLNP
jgi:adhesin/invasin